MTRTDNKITLVNIKFSLNACKSLTKKELDTLSNTATNFFHFIQALGNKLKLRNFVNIWVVEDRVQDLYFYDNLFNPKKNSTIQDKKRLNKRKEKLCLTNVLFSTIKKQTRL